MYMLFFSGDQRVLWRLGHELGADDLGSGALPVVRLQTNVRITQCSLKLLETIRESTSRSVPVHTIKLHVM